MADLLVGQMVQMMEMILADEMGSFRCLSLNCFRTDVSSVWKLMISAFDAGSIVFPAVFPYRGIELDARREVGESFKHILVFPPKSLCSLSSRLTLQWSPSILSFSSQWRVVQFIVLGLVEKPIDAELCSLGLSTEFPCSKIYHITVIAKSRWRLWCSLVFGVEGLSIATKWDVVFRSSNERQTASVRSSVFTGVWPRQVVEPISATVCRINLSTESQWIRNRCSSTVQHSILPVESQRSVEHDTSTVQPFNFSVEAEWISKHH